jgi:hypothetical protein
MRKLYKKITNKLRPVKEQWNLNGVGTAIAAIFTSTCAILVVVGAFHVLNCGRRDWLLEDCQSRVAQSQRWFDEAMQYWHSAQDSLKQERLANQGLMKLLSEKTAGKQSCYFTVEVTNVSDSAALVAGYWIVPAFKCDSTQFQYSKDYDSITVTVKADNSIKVKRTTHKCEERSSNACQKDKETGR